MEELISLKRLFEAYLDEVDEVMRRRKPADGILGFGNAPQNDPCHERFDRAVEAEVQRLLDASPDAAAAEEAVGFLLRDEALSRRAECARWMLIAVQRHALALIPLLSAESAGALLRQYTARYPWTKRFPAQKQVIDALKRQARA